MTELAPTSCIVCGKSVPKQHLAQITWVYLAGAEPLGSMACTPACAEVAVARFEATGRCDAKGEKS